MNFVQKIINVFSVEEKALTSGIETWIVKWWSTKPAWHHSSFESADMQPCYQAFTSKMEAEEFADNINKANKLIGNYNKYYNKAEVYKNDNVGL